jgi:DNA modification methylase
VTVTLLRGDALHLPIADHTVDLICTSPPYFGLRSYQDAGVHYAGQIGSEATPAEWVDAMLAATAEMVRVLKPCGSIWVNLGDKYASSGGHGAGATSQRATRSQYVEQVGRSERNTTGVPTKSLIGLPWRYALACIDQLGLILRAEVIWSKPNGLPESVTDRVRRSHEQWFHFTVQPRYYSAVDEIREPQTGKRGPESYRLTGANGAEPEASKWRSGPADVRPGLLNETAHGRDYNPLGKLPGSVWSISSQPLSVPPELGVDHFAAFPMEWPRRLTAGWSPAGICTGCGEGRRPVVDSDVEFLRPEQRNKVGMGNPHRSDGKQNKSQIHTHPGVKRVTVTGYACACDPKVCRVCGLPSVPFCEGFRCCDSCTHGTTAPTTPGVVLDPFGGTGTTALVAHVMGRHGITVDLSADYCRLAAWRTTDPGQLAQAAQVDKPPAQTVGQDTLFEVTG